jgi:NAD(P)H-quinone oxidoreductase subunit 4L
MTLSALLIVSAALFGIGLFGALSQKSFVMLMMGLELMLNGTLLATVGFWANTLGGRAVHRVRAGGSGLSQAASRCH